MNNVRVRVTCVSGLALAAVLALAACGDGGSGSSASEGSEPSPAATESSAPDLLYESTAAGSVEEFEQRTWCENGSDQVYLARAFAGEAPALQGSIMPEDYEAGVARLAPLSQVVAAQAPTPDLQRAAGLIADNWAAIDELIRQEGGAENITRDDAPGLQKKLDAAVPATAQLREALDEECLETVTGYGERLLPPL